MHILNFLINHVLLQWLLLAIGSHLPLYMAMDRMACCDVDQYTLLVYSARRNANMPIYDLLLLFTCLQAISMLYIYRTFAKHMSR